MQRQSICLFVNGLSIDGVAIHVLSGTHIINPKYQSWKRFKDVLRWVLSDYINHSSVSSMLGDKQDLLGDKQDWRDCHVHCYVHC